MHVCIHIHTHIYIYIYMQIHMHLHIHTHTYTCTLVYTYIHIHIHIHMCVSISEVGGVRAQRPQPGNRFVSFVRASGRAGGARARSNRFRLPRWISTVYGIFVVVVVWPAVGFWLACKAFVSFLDFSRFRRGDFRYTKICFLTFIMYFWFAPPARNKL